MRPIIVGALFVLSAALVSVRAQTSASWIADTATLAGPPSATDVAIIRGIAHRDDVRLLDGVIDFDLSPPVGGFAGIAFRMASTADYEIVYFSPSGDGQRWETVQYQPVFQGETTWQLYRNDGYYARLSPSLPRALHVRIAIAGTRADVYVNSTTAPALRVRELKRDPVSGGIGVWAAPPETGTDPVRFTNVRVDPSQRPTLDPAAPERVGLTQVTRWSVSSRQPSPSGLEPPAAVPAHLRVDDGRWRIVEAESSGLVNLTKALGNPAGAQRTNVFGGAGYGLAFARVTITSNADRVVQLSLAYSDAVGVYLDDRRLYVGRNDSDGRYVGYLGVVAGERDTVDLPLHRGDNVLTLAITDKAFGWGFRAKLSSVDGLTIEP